MEYLKKCVLEILSESCSLDSTPKYHFSFIFQVRTLFVSGLPLDIKPRELYLLFRPFKVPFLSEIAKGNKKCVGELHGGSLEEEMKCLRRYPIK